mmetsp:Transcript_87167/g.271106  ORF Transcript_87167/g.271106 Transcript_87167/m.271106 type:complete len:100 (-) Transcript_87167:59-358(-)
MLLDGLVFGDGALCDTAFGLGSVRLRVASRCHRGPGGLMLLLGLVFCDGARCGNLPGHGSARLRVALRCHRGLGGRILFVILVLGDTMLWGVSAARLVL